ncbi:hypothetical protein ACRALDRAFT_1060816 [Sodiomyces alcalophilus JCM 7366]|uniref:uncharacterized protein n=1 Tax=Sodiomyces alcalophilus JCM 7366 TaxID=591952 RepID=UPI0039B58855
MIGTTGLGGGVHFRLGSDEHVRGVCVLVLTSYTVTICDTEPLPSTNDDVAKSL